MVLTGSDPFNESGGLRRREFELECNLFDYCMVSQVSLYGTCLHHSVIAAEHSD